MLRKASDHLAYDQPSQYRSLVIIIYREIYKAMLDICTGNKLERSETQQLSMMEHSRMISIFSISTEGVVPSDLPSREDK